MKKRNLVYSTDAGRMCPGCGATVAACQCKSGSVPETDGIVRIQRQVKGRAGKPCVIISGLPLAASDLKALAKKLKARCGVGGSIEDGNILIQGDKRELLKAELENLGYTVKFTGG